MELLQNVSLKDYVTFGVEATCDNLYRVQDVEELKLAVQYLENPRVLGGGSNILPIGHISGNVLKMDILGLESSGGDHPLVRVAAGENWHHLVMWALENDLGGIENLSLIPGSVGAAPMQNIGAYGVEIESVFHTLEAVEIGSGKVKTFSKTDCRFGYRNSIFKNEARDQYVITFVTLQLSRDHQLNTSYGAIRETLEQRGISDPTIRDVSDAVISIRQSKLPDPAVIGNAGSFFKNPIIPEGMYEDLVKTFSDMPSFPVSPGLTKIPAGWLIDKAGWKGHTKGHAGCYEKQALVLVNRGGATGEEIWSLAREIQNSVFDKYGIRLDPEVNIWGTNGN